jgi:hypothetical protein
MKTLVSKGPATANRLIRALFVALILAACADEGEVVPVRPGSEDSATEQSRELSNARSFGSQVGPHYNLNVFLYTGAQESSFGTIMFRQYENETQLVHLDTWLHNLEPNTNYLLQRAVDTTLDGNCTSTMWLTLGKGLDPYAITTDKNGHAKAELFRSVATVPVGTTFDIHFQILKESTLEVVLASDCYEYTVR